MGKYTYSLPTEDSFSNSKEEKDQYFFNLDDSKKKKKKKKHKKKKQEKQRKKKFVYRIVDKIVDTALHIVSELTKMWFGRKISSLA